MSNSVANKSSKSASNSNQNCSSSSSGLNRNRKSDDRPHHQSSLSDIDLKPTKQVVRVRSFTTRTGTVVNRGDSFKSRSNHGSSGAVCGGTPRLGNQINSARPRVRRRTGAAENDDLDRDEVDVDYGRRKSLAAEYGSTVGASWITSDGRRQSSGVPDSSLMVAYNDQQHQDHPVAPGRRYQAHRLLSAVASSGGNEDDYGGWSPAHHGGPVFTVLVQGSARVGKRTLVQQLLTSEYLANKECNSPVDDVPEPHEIHTTVSVQIDDEESTVRFVNRTGGNTLDVRENEHGTPTGAAAAATHPHPHHLSRSRSFMGNDGFIVVYSVTDRASFRYAQSCLQELRPEKRCNAVILVANKADVVRNRVVSTSDGARLATRRQCKFIEVSALLDHRVDELLVGIVRQIRLRHEHQLAEPENDDSDSDEYESRYGKLLKSAGSRLAAAIGRLVDRMMTQARSVAASARGQHDASGDGRSRRLKRKQVDECSNLFTP